MRWRWRTISADWWRDRFPFSVAKYPLEMCADRIRVFTLPPREDDDGFCDAGSLAGPRDGSLDAVFSAERGTPDTPGLLANGKALMGVLLTPLCPPFPAKTRFELLLRLDKCGGASSAASFCPGERFPRPSSLYLCAYVFPPPWCVTPSSYSPGTPGGARCAILGLATPRSASVIRFCNAICASSSHFCSSSDASCLLGAFDFDRCAC